MMTKIRKFPTEFLILCFAAALLTGCVSMIPRQYREQVERDLTYGVVGAAVENYIGRTVQWGGVIVMSENQEEGTLIEVIEFPLNWYGKPRTGLHDTAGRFLILHPGYLETELYSNGMEVTVVGDVVGTRELPLGEIVYTYPVVRSKHVHLWEPAGPAISYGIGVYTVY